MEQLLQNLNLAKAHSIKIMQLWNPMKNFTENIDAHSSAFKSQTSLRPYLNAI